VLVVVAVRVLVVTVVAVGLLRMFVCHAGSMAEIPQCGRIAPAGFRPPQPCRSSDRLAVGGANHLDRARARHGRGWSGEIQISVIPLRSPAKIDEGGHPGIAPPGLGRQPRLQYPL